jgi:hypothetical protein
LAIDKSDAVAGIVVGFELGLYWGSYAGAIGPSITLEGIIAFFFGSLVHWDPQNSWLPTWMDADAHDRTPNVVATS